MSSSARRRLARLVVALVVGGIVSCSSGSSEDFCDEAAVVAGDDPAGAFAAWDPANPETAEGLSDAADGLTRLADVAPPEIADDAGLIASTAEELAELLSELRGDELEAAIREREDQFAEVDTASRRLTAFTRTECGVDLETPPEVTTPTVPTSDPPTTTQLP